MTEILVILASIVAVTGIGIAVWSIVDTRRRYYKEYTNRRKNNAEH